jgi:hypothetical protein
MALRILPRQRHDWTAAVAEDPTDVAIPDERTAHQQAYDGTAGVIGKFEEQRFPRRNARHQRRAALRGQGMTEDHRLPSIQLLQHRIEHRIALP